jgi:hypothetical protein
MLSSFQIMFLQKAAEDCGFGVRDLVTRDWLRFSSGICSVQIWLSAFEELYIVALADERILRVIGDGLGVGGRRLEGLNLPLGTVGAVGIREDDLYGVLERVVLVSAKVPAGIRALPVDLPEERTPVVRGVLLDLPLGEPLPVRAPVGGTEVERLVVQRVGQEVFRAGLDVVWNGQCAVTGLGVRELLRASHAKPWAVCSDEERLDPFNGFLLAVHLDGLFDAGFMTFGEDGGVVFSGKLEEGAREVLGVRKEWRVRLEGRHLPYLQWHREKVFRG